MTDIFVEVGRKYTSYVITDVIADILKPDSQYYTRQKSIALKALSAIAKDKKTNTAENMGLAPLLVPFIEEARGSSNDKQIGLMKSALQCWPTVRGSGQSVQTTAAIILPLVLHEDREVSTLAMSSLQDYVLLDMTAHYLPIFHALLHQLNDVDPTQSIAILKTCNNIIVLLQTLADYSRQPPKDSKPFSPQADSWIALREHLEAVAMARLTHTEGWVRTEVLRVLLRLNSADLLSFEEQVPASSRSPKLVEALLPSVKDGDSIPATSEAFYAPLRRLITTPASYVQFQGIIASAWSFLHKRVEQLQRVEAGERMGEEWTAIFHNEFLFLCLTVRPGEGAAAGSGVRTQPLEKQGSTRNAGADAGPTREELVLRLQQRRERLNTAKLQGHEVYYFFDAVVTFLQSTGTNATAQSLRAIIAADLSLVDASNHSALLEHLRQILTVQPDPNAKGKSRVPTPKQGFYYHEFTLDLLSRLLIRVKPDRYHAGPTLLTKTLDDLVLQWTADSPDSYAALSATTRFYIASLLTRFLFYRTVPKQHAQHVSKTELLNKRAFFFTRLVALLKGAEGARDVQVQLESAVLSGVAAVLALGSIQDLPLSNNVLSFLEQELTLQPSPHVHDGVTLCLQLFFRLNSHRLTDFIRFTLPEVHDPTSPHFIPHGIYNAGLRKKGEPPQSRATIAVIARYYVKALSAGFAHDFALWTGEYGVSSAEMLLVSLLLMNSTDGEVRQAALILVQEVLMKDGVSLGGDARLFSPTSPFMYTPGTIQLARAIAFQPHYLGQTPAVLRRAVDLFTYIAEGKKEILLRLLAPFSAQFAPLVCGLDGLSSGTAQVTDAVSDMLTSLFSITRLCSTSGILSQSLMQVWIALLSVEPITEQLVAHVLNHLISHYSSLLTEGSGGVATPPVDRAHPPAAASAAGSAATTPRVSTSAAAAPAETTTAAGRPSLSRTSSVEDEQSKASTSKAAAPATPSSAARVSVGGDSKKAAVDASEESAALSVPDDVELEKPTRDVLLEKALLRMIATHLSRGGHAMLIINGLIAHLRSYPDACPTEPEKFLAWFTEHHQPSPEPTTLVERSAFELIVNTVFERQQAELEDSIPTLLLNAYVLFPGSALSDELLKNVCLVLFMLDVKQLAEVVIGEQFFINNLSATHPELRASFSQAAFIWSINSRDSNIAGAAFRIFQELEAQSFYFGPGQSTLIRVIELVYACLRNKETRRLKSIIQTCLLPTEQPYDQQGWSALLAASVALLSSTEIGIYQLGLQLFQHLFALPIPDGRKKAWLVALGPLFDSQASAEAGPVQLLFKGLTHPVTCDDTLAVLQTLHDFYSGTGSVPNKNRIGITLQLMNVLLRGIELNKMAEEKAKTGVQATEAQLATREKGRVRAVSSLASLSSSLFDLSDAGGDDGQHFDALANIFKNVALSLALTLPDAVAPTELAEGAEKPVVSATPEAARTAAYSQLLTLVKQSGPVQQVGALDGRSIPATTQLLIPFFRSFGELYDSQDQFEYVISFFSRALQRQVAEWRTLLLLMLGRFLLQSTYKVNIDAFVPLSEAVAASYYSTDKDEQLLAENLAFLLVQKRGTGQAKSSDVFNLIKTRAGLRRAAASTTSLNLPEEKVDVDTLLTAALQRMQQTAFPSLKQMNAKAREINRTEHPVSPRNLKVSPSPSVLLANNNAADVADSVGRSGDWQHLERLLSAGVHGGTAVTLAAATSATTAGAKQAEQKEGAEEAAEARVPFSSLLTVAEQSKRETKEKVEVNPFAEEEAGAGQPKSNPFGSDDEKAADEDEGKEGFQTPEPVKDDDDDEDMAKAPGLNGSHDDSDVAPADKVDKAEAGEAEGEDEGEASSNPFA